MSFRKKKYYFIFLLVLVTLILFFIGWHDIRKGSSFAIFRYIGFGFKLPTQLRTTLKNTIFILPTLQKKVEEQNDELNKLKNIRRHAIELWYTASAFDFKKINSYFFGKKNIKSKSGAYTYEVKLFSLPFHNFGVYDSPIPYTKLLKPVAYLEQSKDQVFLASGNGVFFSFTKNRITALMNNRNSSSKFNRLELKKIKSNIRDLIKNEKFYLEGYPAIRDLLILDNKLFVSYNNTPTKECYNTSIMVAELNINYLNFSEFFSYDECVSKENKKSTTSFGAPAAWSSGGRMFPFKNGKIIFSIGEYNDRVRAQDKNSMFGKIISLDLITKEYELISMGHRNQQGLYYSENNDVIILTEHGPRGGDEINVNLEVGNKVENFGWPISSYGTHYDSNYRDRKIDKYKEEAPLHKSHKEYGFIEPIKYFTPSIAITQIIKIPNTFNEKFTNDFFIGAMGSKIDEGDLSVHHIRFNKDFNKIKFEDIIPFGQRVRDMIFIREQNIILLVFENIPALAILKNID